MRGYIGPPNTIPIYFVTTALTNSMQVTVSAGGTVTWGWGDGTTNTSPTHTFTNAGTYTNSVTISPANTLIAFGVACQTDGTPNTVSSVWGLTNYPSVKALYFYQSELSQISFAGCTNLVYIAAVGCSPTNAQAEDDWFNELYGAQVGLTTLTWDTSCCGDYTHIFYYPSSPGYTSASQDARNFLQSIGWSLVGD